MCHTCSWLESHGVGHAEPECSLPLTHVQMCNQEPAFSCFHDGSTELHRAQRDVKTWPIHQHKLFYGLSAWHDEDMALLLKTKLSAPKGTQRRGSSSWQARWEITDVYWQECLHTLYNTL